MKHTLVTGASGLIGQAVVRTLLRRGVAVHATARKAVVPNLAHAEYDPALLLQTSGDLDTDHEFAYSLLRQAETSAVIHCAARISGVAGQLTDPAFAVTSNLCMTARLLEAAAKAEPQPKRFVFLSSSTVYEPVNYPVHEDGHKVNGRGHYAGVGDMKLYLESLCSFYSDKFDLRTTILRPTAIYGPGDRSAHVIPDLIRQAWIAPSRSVLLRGANDVRDFVYVDDVAEACVLAATRTAYVTGPYNIGSGVKTTLRELALTIRPDWEIVDGGPGASIPYRQVEIGRAKQMLDWAPKTALKDGIEKTVAWMRERARS